MINPITAVKQKYEDHKVVLVATAGVVAGSVVTFAIMKKLPTKQVNMLVNVPQSVEDIRKVLENIPNGIFEIASDDNLITVVTTDAIKELL